jgi:DNA-directed RNA polymerase subunit F
MTKKKSKKQLTDAEYLEIFENFDPTKWRELTPEELAEHRERAKDAVIVEVEEIDPAR